MDNSEDSKRDEALEADRKRFEEIDARLEAARPPGPPYQEVCEAIRDAVYTLKDKLVAEYRDYHGRDWRPKISFYLEHAGHSVHSEVEGEKQRRRDEKRALNIAKDNAQQKKMTDG